MWTPPNLAQLPSWSEAKRVAVDCEFRDDTLTSLGPGVRRGAYIVGVSFAIEGGPRHYLPVAHEAGGNLNKLLVFAYLRAQGREFKGELVGANMQIDLDFLEEQNITFPKVTFKRDVQVAEPLIDELQMLYSVEAITDRRGIEGKDEALLVEAAAKLGITKKNKIKANIWRMHSSSVGPYAEQDASLLLPLLRQQEAEIDKPDKLGRTMRGIYDLESKLLPVLLKMRRWGVRINFDKLDKAERWSIDKEREELNEVYRLTGVRLVEGDITKSAMKAKVFDAIGYKLPLTPKTKKPQVTAAIMKAIDHPAAKRLLRACQANKLRTTFIKSIRAHATNGRVHCTFNQLRSTDDNSNDDESGARFGRLSSCDPNLQQQTSKEKDPEIGGLLRSVYEPDNPEEEFWVVQDYSQQEPRWLVHFAERKKCQDAKVAGDRYRNDPKTDNHQMTADLTGVPRKQAKEIFLGRCYGMGSAKMARKCNLPTEWKFSKRQGKEVEIAGPEGMALINKFDAGVPFVKQLSQLCETAAKEFGYITTILGRRCHFPKKPNGEYDWTYKALNRLIQGSSGDQSKKALVDADAAGLLPQLQVHDEFDKSESSMERVHALTEIMKNAVPATVPFKVDVEIGPNWGEVAAV